MCDDIIGALFLAQLQGPVSTLGFRHFAARQRASRAFVVFDRIAGGGTTSACDPDRTIQFTRESDQDANRSAAAVRHEPAMSKRTAELL